MVSAKDFCDAFAEQWNEDTDSGRDAILDAYEDNKRWTEYMLAKKEGSFLGRLLKKLPPLGRRPSEMGREWYTLDAVYYEKDACIYRPKDGGPYPDCLHVIIEHENAGDVETEMWKLLMFRSPLKVLIFYDYRDDDKETDEKKEWLARKVSKLFEMGWKVERRCSEADNVKYLFLVGNRSEEGQLPCWRYLAVEQGGFKQPSGEDSFQLLC